MKRVKLFTLAAFVFAVVSAFAPRVAASLRTKPYTLYFVPAAPCTATIQCSNTGLILCGYKTAGCADQVNKQQ